MVAECDGLVGGVLEYSQTGKGVRTVKEGERGGKSLSVREFLERVCGNALSRALSAVIRSGRFTSCCRYRRFTLGNGS